MPASSWRGVSGVYVEEEVLSGPGWRVEVQRVGGQRIPSSVRSQIDPVHRLFLDWGSDVAAKRVQAEVARDFGGDPDLFALACALLNRQGEVRSRSGRRRAQDWYFVPRRSPGQRSEHECVRCHRAPPRQELIFVDCAKFQHQEELCRPCFFFVLRSLLGDDDATIQEQGRALRSELWHPVIDDALADALTRGRRMYFASL